MVTHDMDVVPLMPAVLLSWQRDKHCNGWTPEDVFYDNFEKLARCGCVPHVVDYCRRLKEYGVPRFLTSDDLTALSGDHQR